MRPSSRLTALTLIVVSATLNARADTARDIDRKAPRPGPDFPNLESYYPAVAKRAGQQGIAVIHFCVDPQGKLTEPPSLAGSSGNDVLDAAATNLATVGSGHYLPALENGVPVRGCATFRIVFKLTGSVFLPLNDPRFPTIGARIGKLDAEFSRRMEELVGQLGRPSSQQLALAPGDPASVRAIRQYARGVDSLLDESVGLTADFLDDVDYLEKSPDIPEAERVVFAELWPDQRAAVAAQIREMTGAVRDVVRAMDELGDYIGFSAPRRPRAGQSVESQTPEQDPQITALQERVKRAMERLRGALKAMGGDPP